MGKRTLRYLHHEVPHKREFLLQKDIHCVTWEGITYYGSCIGMDERILTLEDKNAHWYNRKKHQHQILLSDIREIIFDRVTDW